MDQPWTYAAGVSFDYEITDITKPYDLVLGVGHTSEFPYENVYVNVTTTFPDGNKTTNPLSLQFSNTDGAWLGDCSGDDCVVEIAMSSEAFFAQKGKYVLTFDQYSRTDSLHGISSLELKVIESEK